MFLYSDGACEYLCMFGLKNHVARAVGALPNLDEFVEILEQVWSSTDMSHVQREFDSAAPIRVSRSPSRRTLCQLCRGRGGTTVMGQWVSCAPCNRDVVDIFDASLTPQLPSAAAPAVPATPPSS